MSEDKDRMREIAEMENRLRKIDKMFSEATGWGSWMVDASNQREAIVDRLLNEFGVWHPHKHLARAGSGGPVS